jgi:hypothetical protein
MDDRIFVPDLLPVKLKNTVCNIESTQNSSKVNDTFSGLTTYWHNQAHKLETYLKDGRINIDNNRAERAVKPFVIGRKNWLFSNTSRGANASALLYSFVETAKANGLLVDSYLQTCLNELAKKPESLEHLLPWNIKQGKTPFPIRLQYLHSFLIFMIYFQKKPPIRHLACLLVRTMRTEHYIFITSISSDSEATTFFISSV